MEGPVAMYCINLKHRTDRWERFNGQPELKRLQQQYRFERFEGINGANLNIADDTRISLRTKRNISQRIRRSHEELETAGGVGCYLSHTSLWKEITERPEPYAIIFEDDADIPVGFTEKLQAAMKQVTLLPRAPDVWFFSIPHLWYFQHKGKPIPQNVATQVVGPWVMKSCAVFTGYMISKRGAEKLLKTAFPIDMHVDLYACLAGEMNEVLTVAHESVYVKPFSLKTVDTDIHSDKECSICDIPTNYSSRGYIVVNLPLLGVSLGIIGYLWYLSRGRGGRR